MSRYVVTTAEGKLWRRNYIGKAYGPNMAVAFTPEPMEETPLTEGDVLTLIDYRATSPGVDVIDAAYFKRESDGTEGFMSPCGVWGTINTDALRKVDA